MIELSVVVLVLLSLTVVLYIGFRGWQRGTERARCMLTLRQMQMSVRAFAASNDHEPGKDLAALDPPVSLLAELVGPGKYVPELPRCPGAGMYLFGDDVVPALGQLYMRCSLATEDGHEPDDLAGW